MQASLPNLRSCFGQDSRCRRGCGLRKNFKNRAKGKCQWVICIERARGTACTHKIRKQQTDGTPERQLFTQRQCRKQCNAVGRGRQRQGGGCQRKDGEIRSNDVNKKSNLQKVANGRVLWKDNVRPWATGRHARELTLLNETKTRTLLS